MEIEGIQNLTGRPRDGIWSWLTAELKISLSIKEVPWKYFLPNTFSCEAEEIQRPFWIQRPFFLSKKPGDGYGKL